MILKDSKMNMEENNNNKILLLFDVDGTLTPARKVVEEEMINILKKLKKNPNIKLAYVGGSDFPKQLEQLKEENMKIFDYMFPENGLIAYKNNKQYYSKNILSHFTEESLQEFINEILFYFSKLKLPKKRGTFIEYRTGVINVSPIGRNASHEERDEFEIYDKKHNIRKDMIKHLKNKFPDSGLTYSIGGQISFDVFPNGWNKTYCLKHIEHENFDSIHFFGDKTFEGGNDYEIYEDKRTIGHTVQNPQETIEILKNFL
ncbi:MAG: HAD-IIB family hydrolase [Nanoarchaeota archaeon]|nr:HAD-IIB family hydrolase [Nanoarchaeota archaeon]